MGRKVKRIDWALAKAMYERGDTWVKIAGMFECNPQRFTVRAKAEKWTRTREPVAVVRNNKRRAYREFIERDREAIVESLTKKNELNARILALAETQIEKLEAGEMSAQADAIRALKDLAGIVKTVGDADAELGALSDQRWREKTAPDAPLKDASDRDFMDLRDVPRTDEIN